MLVVVLVFSLRTGKSKTVRQEGAAAPGTAEETASGIVPTKRRARRTRYTAWGRNPFAPAAVGQARGEMVLSGIMWDETDPTAIINDEIVRVGDSVGGRKVVDIKQDRVIVDDGSGKVEIRLWQDL